MAKEKKWAFLSDYFRLKALYEIGGIYLDTDEYVCKDFDKYLNCDFLCSYFYDYALGTEMFGAKKNSELILGLLRLYDNITEPVVNNGLYTEYIRGVVKGFLLTGKKQELTLENGDKFVIYPKNLFHKGKVFGRSVAIHLALSSWQNKKSSKMADKLKIMFAKLPFNLFALKNYIVDKKLLKKDGLYQNWYREDIKKLKQIKTDIKSDK